MTHAMLNKLQVVAAASPGNTSTYLDVNSEEAKTILSAVKRLANENKRDLLNQPLKNMLFLARAIVDNPKTAYPVLKQNFSFILNPVRQGKPHKVEARAPNPVAKTNLLKIVCTVLKEYGFKVPQARIKLTPCKQGMKFSFPVPAGTAYGSIMGAKAKISLYYTLLDNKITMEDVKGGVRLSFTVTGVRKSSPVLEKLKKVTKK